MSNYFLSGLKKAVAEDTSKWQGVFHYVAVSFVASAGLGNVWKYPDFSLGRGAGAYLIAYFIVLVTLGIPLYCLEIFIGQFLSRGPTQVYRSLSPALSGMGWCQAAAAFLTATYVSVFTGLTLVYFLQSLSSPVPWSTCRPEWNTSCLSCQNISNFVVSEHSLSEELYFQREIMQIKPNGTITKCNVIVLIYTWFFIFLLSMNGTKMNKYVSYFMALLPFPVLFGMIGRAIRFEGVESVTTSQFQLHPALLIKPAVWYDAITRCVASLSLGTGTVVVLASHNKFYYHAKSSTMLLVLVRTIASLVFETILFLVREVCAHRLKLNPQRLTLSIPYILFVMFPTSLCDPERRTNVSLSLFYFAMFVASLGTVFGLLIVVNKHLQACFPSLTSWQAAILSTISGFSVALMYFIPAGSWMLHVININVNILVMLILMTLTILTVNYCYGMQNFCWDAEYMSQGEIGFYWRFCWSIVDLTLIGFVLPYAFLSTSVKYYCIFSGHSINHRVFGWLLFICVLAPMLMAVSYRTFRSRSIEQQEDSNLEGVVRKKSEWIFLTDNKWRPEDEQRYLEWQEVKRQAVEKSQMNMDTRFVRFHKFLMRKYN